MVNANGKISVRFALLIKFNTIFGEGAGKLIMENDHYILLAGRSYFTLVQSFKISSRCRVTYKDVEIVHDIKQG